MEMNSTSGWRIGRWQYWPDSGELKMGAQKLRISTQLNQVLWLLVEKSPDVVSRQQFLDEIWADKYVNEDALSRTIAELRKVLGDSASQAKYIKTIPKKGYQLTQSVEPLKVHNNRRLKITAVFMLLVIGVSLSFWFSNRETTLGMLQDAVAKASRMTAQPGMEKQSILSSDGQWLAYVKDHTNSSQIIIQAISDSNQQIVVELPQHRMSSPVYIAEQDLLVFMAQDQNDCYLKTYALDTQTFADLSTCHFEIESRTLSWDAALNSLFFSALSQQNKISIQQLELSTGLKTWVTHPETINQQDWSPQISPNHQWLSFSRGNETVRNIWLKNLQNGKEMPLTVGEHYTVSHTWFDEDHLVFDSDMNGSRQLWLMNIHDPKPRLLGAYGAQHPSFDLDQRLMTFQEVSYEANIWLLDLDSKTYERVIHSTKYDNYPNFSADGSRFLFSSNRQDLSSIWLYDINTGSEQLLYSQAAAKLTRPSWHHSGEQVLMTINDEQGYGSLLLDLKSMQTVKLDFGYGHMSPVEFEGSYYALAKSAELQHKVLRLKQNQVDILPVDDVSRFMILEDGRLVFSKIQANGLFLYDMKKAQQTVLTTALNSNSFNYWTVANQSVYYDRNDDRPGLWRLDIDSGEQQYISPHRPSSVGTSLSVNADETMVLITQTDRAESDILKTTVE